MPPGKKQKKQAVTRAPKTEQLNRTTEAIINSTMQLLEEVGYRGLTIRLISSHSGVARSTIYRRWDSVQGIVIFSVNATSGLISTVPETGDIRLNLLIIFKRLAEKLEHTSFGRILPSLVEAAAYDSELHSLLIDFMRPPRLDAILMMERAKERNEIRQDIDTSWFLDSIAGPLYFRLLIKRNGLSEPGYIEYLIDSALNYILCDSDSTKQKIPPMILSRQKKED